MPDLTDPTIARAVRDLMEASSERRKRLADDLELADREHEVVSRLHDLLIDAESRRGLRVVG